MDRMRFLIKPHAASIGFRSGEWGGRNCSVAPRCSMSWRTRRSLCAPRLSRTTMSPGRSLGARPPATHATKRSALAVCQLVRIVSQRSARIAPIIVKLSPQCIGRGSTTTAPRWTHACDRPIARFAPDSSTNTSRAGSTPVAHWRNAARLARTSGRSCSAGRGRFFKHVSRPPQRAQDTRPMDPVRQGHPPGVYARQFPGGGIRRVPGDRVHHLEHHG